MSRQKCGLDIHFGGCKCKQIVNIIVVAIASKWVGLVAASACCRVSNLVHNVALQMQMLKCKLCNARCKCKLQMQAANARCKCKMQMQVANASCNCNTEMQCKMKMLACKLQMLAYNLQMQDANASCKLQYANASCKLQFVSCN
ncbi:hypothetical protein Tco_0058315 [Tanacetum coccineum]